MFTLITAVASPDVDEDHTDSAIHGTYLVELRNDVPLDRIASASLDGFHENFGISILEDFSITVFDYKTGAVITEPENAETYQSGSYCTSVEFLSEDADPVNYLQGADSEE